MSDSEHGNQRRLLTIFTSMTLWEQVVAGLLVLGITALLGYVSKAVTDEQAGGGPTTTPSPARPRTSGPNSSTSPGSLQAETQLPAVEDVYVDSSDPRQPKRREVLRVGLAKNGNSIYRSLLQFDVAPIRDTRISRATLRLWNNEANSCNARAVLAYPVLTEWAAEQTSWSNQPPIEQRAEYVARGLFSYGYEEGGCDNDFGTIDVTPTVIAWANGSLPNKGLMLRADETNYTDASGFCSRSPRRGSHATSCNSDLHTPTLLVQHFR